MIELLIDGVAVKIVRGAGECLADLVRAGYGGDSYSGVIYVFRAKRTDRIKLVWWDGSGLCRTHPVGPALSMS